MVGVAGSTAIGITGGIGGTASGGIRAVADSVIAVAIGCVLGGIIAVG